MVPMRTQNMAIGLNLYLGSQFICFVSFWVSYCGWSYARQTQIYFYFLVPFFLPDRITPLLSLSLSLSKCLLSFPSAVPRIANPFSLLSSPIYRLG